MREKWYSYNMKRQKLPKNFKPLLWSYKFFAINPEKDKKSIFCQASQFNFSFIGD